MAAIDIEVVHYNSRPGSSKDRPDNWAGCYSSRCHSDRTGIDYCYKTPVARPPDRTCLDSVAVVGCSDREIAGSAVAGVVELASKLDLGMVAAVDCRIVDLSSDASKAQLSSFRWLECSSG